MTDVSGRRGRAGEGSLTFLRQAELTVEAVELLHLRAKDIAGLRDGRISQPTRTALEAVHAALTRVAGDIERALYHPKDPWRSDGKPRETWPDVGGSSV